MPVEKAPVQRIYGSEIEYSYSLEDKSQSTFGKVNYPDYLNHFFQFLGNGARHYLDMNGFPEYATGESPNIEGVVLAEIVGEKIIADAYLNGKSTIQVLHKRSSSPNRSRSTGAHENYLTPLLISNVSTDRDAIFSLAGFNATRTIFTGSGQPTESGKYSLSQKVFDLREVASTSTTNDNKPLVNLRNEPHTGDKETDLFRLHVTSGDHNISPWVIGMKFGTYSLMLRLLEHNSNLKDLHFEYPLAAAHTVADDIKGLQIPLPLMNGKSITAVEYQHELANRAAALGDKIELPQEEKDVLTNWFTILDSLERYSKTGELQPEMKKLDWATKYEFIRAKKEKDMGKSLSPRDEFKQAQAIDIAYHVMPDSRYPKMSLGMKLRESRFAQETPSAELIEEWKTKPFPLTRGAVRGAFIEELTHHSPTEKSTGTVSVNWNSLKFRTGKNVKLALTELYTDERIQEILTQVFDPDPLKGQYAQIDGAA